MVEAKKVGSGGIYWLSRRLLKGLFVWYAGLLIGGLGVAVFVLLHDHNIANSNPVMVNAIVGSFGASALGSSVFYVRKLYKHSIRGDIATPASESEETSEVGVFVYFFFRPLFALAFAFLVVLFFKVSTIVVAVKDGTLDEGFIYLTMFLSFFAGFSSGDILGMLEQLGRERMRGLFSAHE